MFLYCIVIKATFNFYYSMLMCFLSKNILLFLNALMVGGDSLLRCAQTGYRL